APGTARPTRAKWSGWNASAPARATTGSIRPRDGLTARTTTDRHADRPRRAPLAQRAFVDDAAGARAGVVVPGLAEIAPEQVGELGPQAPARADAALREQGPAHVFGFAGDAVVAVAGFALGDVVQLDAPVQALSRQLMGQFQFALERLLPGDAPALAGHRVGDRAVAPQRRRAQPHPGQADRVQWRGKVERQCVAPAVADVA